MPAMVVAVNLMELVLAVGVEQMGLRSTEELARQMAMSSNVIQSLLNLQVAGYFVASM